MTRRQRAYVFYHAVPGSQIVHGIVQPPDTVRLPRRYPSRAVVRFTAAPGYINGQVQPLATRQMRRYPFRGQFRGSTGLAHQPAITWFTQIPRRKSARGQYRNISAPQPPSGTPQSWPTREPRRTAARGYWKQVRALLPGAPYIQPWPTIAVPRRYPVRAHVSLPYASNFGQQATPGTISGKPQQIFLSARKDKRQRVWYTSKNAGPGYINGQVQPTATRQPRRISARAVFIRSAQGQPFFSYVQPWSTLPKARRYPSRGQYHGNAVPPIASRYVQPRVVVVSRLRTRAYTQHILGPNWFFGTGGKIQPLQTRPARRSYARALVQSRHGPLLSSVNFALEFNIIEIEARNFEMAFNILPGTGARVGLLASVPMLSPSVSKMYPGGYLQNPTGDAE